MEARHSQWMTGRPHPMFDTDEIPPMEEDEVTLLEEHLTRRAHVASLFHKADAKATVTLAARARNRRVISPEVGMLVYYYRRQKGTRYQAPVAGYRGPARVIAVEPSMTRNGTSVVWLSHGGNLIRGAPEHLRFATDLEK